MPREYVRTQPCGTNAGYAYHADHGTPVCEACAEARRVYERERRTLPARWRGLGLGMRVKCSAGLGWPAKTRALPGETAAAR